MDAADPLGVDDDDLARLDVADVLGLDEVEGARLRRQHEGAVVHAAQGQRPEPMGIAGPDEFVLGEDHQRIGAFDAAHGLDQGTLVPGPCGLGQEMQDDLAVHRGLEDGSAGLEFLAQLGRVGEVAVVADGDAPLGAVHGQGLGVDDVRRTGGRIARVPNAGMAYQTMQNIAGEDLRHQAHAPVDVEGLAVGGDDARTLLPTVLKGVEAVVGQFGGIRMPMDAKDPAVMLRMVLHETLGESGSRGRRQRAFLPHRPPRRVRRPV